MNSIKMVSKFMGIVFAHLLVEAIKLYRISLGRYIGGRCRFYPTCSEYFIIAVEKYGPLKGLVKGIWRLLRCNPFSKGGYDLP